MESRKKTGIFLSIIKAKISNKCLQSYCLSLSISKEMNLLRIWYKTASLLVDLAT